MPVNMKDCKERGTVSKGSNYYPKRFRHVSINIRAPQTVNHVYGLVTNKSVTTPFTAVEQTSTLQRNGNSMDFAACLCSD